MIQGPKLPVTLIFDGDSSLWGDEDNDHCSLCGSNSPSYVRIREKKSGQSELVGHVCPTCVVRMMHQVELHNWWRHVKVTVKRAFERVLARTRVDKQTEGYFNLIAGKALGHKALGHRPEPKKPSSALDKLLPSGRKPHG